MYLGVSAYGKCNNSHFTTKVLIRLDYHDHKVIMVTAMRVVRGSSKHGDWNPRHTNFYPLSKYDSQENNTGTNFEEL